MGKYHDYYDKLNLGKKNYEKEIVDLKIIYDQLSSKPLNKILEIGCGTGNHTQELIKLTEKVFSVDIDPAMIEIARKKLQGKNVVFHCNKIPNISERDFPLCVMMWNILNYFPNLKEMNDIFKNISDRLLPGGIFFFDMWNGVAAIKDPPQTSANVFEVDGKKVIHILKGETNLMEQKTDLYTSINVLRDNQLIESFQYDYTHYLWTFKTVKDLLDLNGIETLRVVKTTNYDVEASDKDWKIMIIARKKVNGFI